MREGCTFEIVPAERVPAELDALERISDAWLTAKHTREKRFSVGRFERGYVARTPVALVRREGREVASLVAHRRTVVEGYKTTESFADLCVERKIEAPILREVRAILTEGKKPAAALASLMTRELKREAPVASG